VRVRCAAVLSAVAVLAAACSSSPGGGSGGPTSGGPPSGGPVASVSTPASGSAFRGATFVQPHPRPSFVLTDTTGRRYDFAARTRGRPTFLFFGYTHCPDVCPTTMADVASALRGLPAGLRDSVRVVFVTTDPTRDTPATLAAWLANFDADLRTRFVGLTGPQAEIDAAQRGAGVVLAQDGGQTHSAQLLLYGPDDLCRVFYLAGASPADIAHDLPLVAKG
jgi:protein SCO1/2